MIEKYALRKSHGPLSSGTRVEIIDVNDADGTYLVRTLDNIYEEFIVEPNELVKLRNHTDEVPKVNCRQRRKLLRELTNKTGIKYSS